MRQSSPSSSLSGVRPFDEISRPVAVLRSRNGSAPRPAATEPTTATKNRWSELKTG
ncbi:hypothetical protein GR241_13895 [Rhizobium leguminosarum]|nr:hypothetical protein [Rhizobium ruizarguesonis]